MLGKAWVRLLALVLVVSVPLAVFAVGCNPECVDRYDCRAKGASYLCVSNRCEPCDPAAAGLGPNCFPLVDSGSPPVDAGAKPDAGVDAGKADAGPPDAGPPDSGPPDSGP